MCFYTYAHIHTYVHAYIHTHAHTTYTYSCAHTHNTHWHTCAHWHTQAAIGSIALDTAVERDTDPEEEDLGREVCL